MCKYSNKIKRLLSSIYPKYFILTGVFAFGIFSIVATGPPPPPPSPPTEKFFLGYGQAGTAIVKVRWSEDGVDWQDGNLPSVMTSAGCAYDGCEPGIGAASDDRGFIHLLAFNKSDGKMGIMWGLGPAVWDSSPREAYSSASSPSVAYINNSFWMMVTYNGHARFLTVGIYDDNGEVVAWSPLGGTGSTRDQRTENVQGRPAVTVKDGKVLVAWRSWNSGAFRLFTSTAEVPPADIDTYFEQQSYWGSIPNDKWSDITEVPLPLTPEFGAGISSGPDLTYDGQNYYIIFVRKQRSTGSGAGDPLIGWRSVVHSSADGVSWQHHSTPMLEVKDGSLVNIAAKFDGTMIAAAVNSPGSNSRISASCFDGSQWRSLDDTQLQRMFGASLASGSQFALIRTRGTPSETLCHASDGND